MAGFGLFLHSLIGMIKDSQKEKEPVKSNSIQNRYEEKCSGEHSGKGYVDLGLPSGTLWAYHNVGTSVPNGMGCYFQWGHTGTEVNKIHNRPAGTIPTVTIPRLDMAHDAANANWGGLWRMPTKEECEELTNLCKWELATCVNAIGYKVTGPNGHSIFLPRTGYVVYKKAEFFDYGRYWTSQQVEEGEEFVHAYALTTSPYGEPKYTISKKLKIENSAVRPVFSKPETGAADAPEEVEFAALDLNPKLVNDVKKTDPIPRQTETPLPEKPPKKKSGFLLGLGISLMIMSAPLFVRANELRKEAEVPSKTNSVRADNIRNQADLNKTLAILLLVGGLASFVGGIAVSLRPEKSATSPAAVKNNASGEDVGKILSIILAVVFGLSLLALSVIDKKKMKEKDDRIAQLASESRTRGGEVERMKSEIQTLNTDLQNLKDEKDQLENTLAKFPPLVITDVKMGITKRSGEVVVEPGKTIYGSETMFLSPQIAYHGTRSESIDLKIKLFNPDGKLRGNFESSPSPSDFTYKTSLSTSEGDDTELLTGWGRDTKGTYSAGSYRLEIWYDTMCLYTKTFRIY